MKSAFWGYWLIILGVFVVIVMLLIQNVTTGNTQSYSMVKEITEAAMIDAVDFGYYRQYGEAKINKEKFMEAFLRRLAESGNGSTTYEVEFYELYEAPPKVSVKVSSSSNTFNVMGDAESFDIVNTIEGILEGNPN